MQISEPLTQRKFVSSMCHAQSNAHKPPKTVKLLKQRKFVSALGLGMQIPRIPAQRKFVSAGPRPL